MVTFMMVFNILHTHTHIHKEIRIFNILSHYIQGLKSFFIPKQKRMGKRKHKQQRGVT